MPQKHKVDINDIWQSYGCEFITLNYFRLQSTWVICDVTLETQQNMPTIHSVLSNFWSHQHILYWIVFPKVWQVLVFTYIYFNTLKNWAKLESDVHLPDPDGHQYLFTNLNYTRIFYSYTHVTNFISCPPLFRLGYLKIQYVLSTIFQLRLTITMPTRFNF